MSNVIKSSYYISLDDKVRIESNRLTQTTGNNIKSIHNINELSPEEQEEINVATAMKEQILKDAEAFAEQQIQQALQECNALKDQANAEVDRWWDDRRSQDEDYIQQAKDAGFEQGFQKGLAQAEDTVKEKYAEMLQEARTILEQSYALKQQIIQESEPFLIELSCSIANKIIGQQLTLSPEWVSQMIQKILARRREKGMITLCVSPEHFAYIQNAREELLVSIDSQAELEIIPDSTVRDQGCVIRSSFGSIDARIETQLSEIKTALQQIAARSEGVEL